MLPIRFVHKAVPVLFGALLLLHQASFPEQGKEEAVIERKPTYIPAGSGQKPFEVTWHIIALDQIQSGGPPKDGIPALDHPAFMSAPEAGRSLKAEDMILGVEFAGVAKAYPVRILNWHEVDGETKIYPYSELKKAGASVEDEMGGLKFAVSFDAKEQSATVRASTTEPPSHFVAFLGDARAFFPDAALFKVR